MSGRSYLVFFAIGCHGRRFRVFQDRDPERNTRKRERTDFTFAACVRRAPAGGSSNAFGRTKVTLMLQIKRLRFKAIALGVISDTVGTLAVAALLFFAMAAAGIPEAEIRERMRGASGLMLMLILGLGFTMLGGYVSGRSARRGEILHGAIVGGIGLVFGLFLREPGLPLWYEVISFGVMIPIGMAGGFIAHKVNAEAG